ncbi:MAG: GxxExxY protein [Actinomycetota bacterium]
MTSDADEKDPLTGAVLSAAFEVSNLLGHGFVEAVYQRALAHELMLRGIRAEREAPFRVTYKDQDVGTYVADLVVEGRVIVELKCTEALVPAHMAQCLNYLNASGLKTGLLINFGRPRVEYRRVIR